MPARTWRPEDLEEVRCFRCGMEGERLYSRGLFGVVRCPGCGQVYISPRVRDLGAIYEDPAYFEAGVYGFSRRFNLAMTLQRIWSRARLRLIRETVARQDAPGRRLLEIGCAYGLFLQQAKDAGFDVSGIEYSQTAVQWARRLGLDVQQGEIEGIALAEGSYDVVCFWDVLEHVRDPATFLSAVGRALKENGFVFLACPYFNSLPARVFRSRWWTLRPEQHLWHFTTTTLEMVLADAGFRLVRVIRSPLSGGNLARPDSLVAIAQRSAVANRVP